MRFHHFLLVPALVAATSAFAAPTIEVTRFHTPETLATLGSGAVEVVAAPGLDARSLETRDILDAVARELSTLGFVAQVAPAASRVAEVTLTRDVVAGGERRRGGSSVSVGIGVGSGGGWYGRHHGSGVDLGVGLGFPIAPGRGSGGEVESELSVRIRDKATGAALWEGRADIRTSRRAADDPETTDRLAHALFAGFPGASGATIEVK